MKRLYSKHEYAGKKPSKRRSMLMMKRHHGVELSRNQVWGNPENHKPKPKPKGPPIPKTYERMPLNSIVIATRTSPRKKIANNKTVEPAEHTAKNTDLEDEYPDNAGNTADLPNNPDVTPEEQTNSSGMKPLNNTLDEFGTKQDLQQPSERLVKEGSDIKSTGGTCQGCMATVKNVRSMLEESEYHVDGHNYVQLFWECFNLEVGSFCPEEIPFICTYCVNKLNVAWLFRSLVEHTQTKLKSMELKEEIRYEDIDYEVLNDKQNVSNDGLNLENYEHTEEENCSEDQDNESEYNFDPICEPNFNATTLENELDHFQIYIQELRLKYLNHKDGTPFAKTFRNENEKHGIKRFTKKCNECKMVFKSHTKLMQHLTVHFPNYVCSVCGDIFFNIEQFKSHTRKKHFKPNISCKLCLESIKEAELSDHMKSVHNSAGSYICDCCNHSYSSRNALMNHLMPKSKLIRFVCKICQKDFSSKHGLNRHMLKHTGKREFVCPVCKKGFLKKDTLTAHMKIHCDVKDFICGVCSKEFTYKCSLKAHVEKYHQSL